MARMAYYMALYENATDWGIQFFGDAPGANVIGTVDDETWIYLVRIGPNGAAAVPLTIMDFVRFAFQRAGQGLAPLSAIKIAVQASHVAPSPVIISAALCIMADPIPVILPPLPPNQNPLRWLGSAANVPSTSVMVAGSAGVAALIWYELIIPLSSWMAVEQSLQSLPPGGFATPNWATPTLIVNGAINIWELTAVAVPSLSYTPNP